jgi:ABC-type transport system involved in cytochrome c biogenesis permease subunit
MGEIMNFSSTLATMALSFFVLTSLIQIVHAFLKQRKNELLSPLLQIAGVVSLFLALMLRSRAIGFFALTSMYESLSFYAMALCAILVVYRFQKRIVYKPFLALLSNLMVIILLMVASSPLFLKEALPPIPALRSNWLVAHVGFSFIGEAFFLVGCITALVFLCTKDDEQRLEYDRLTYTAISIGYVFFTAGALVFGSIWAEQAWGRFWSWDPKETWALVSWLIYTVYLHVRLIRNNKGSLPAIISVVGFLLTVFTFFGVNFLLPGLHRYG